MRNLISKRIQFLLLTLFFFSGLSALVYEVVFSRSLALIFGTTTYAIATILAVFMAGLALGSFLFGKIVDKYKNPLLFYALLELGIGLYCLFTPLIFKAIEGLQINLWQTFEPSFSNFSLLRFGLSFLALIFPTTLMGGTLPVISKFFVLQKEQLGEKVGLLYFVNTFGAVLGSFLAGFVLIILLGVNGAIYTAAGLNVLIGIAVLGLAFKSPIFQPKAGPPWAENLKTKSWLLIIVLIAFFFSGLAALALEVLWTRVLVMILGSSVYAFAIILASFLFGIAVGSLLVAKWIDKRKNLLLYFALTQILLGFLVLILTPLFDNLPFLFFQILKKFSQSFWAVQTAQFFLSFIIILLPTLLMGATFPIVTKIYTQELKHLGFSIGRVYAANTLGGVLGPLVAGFLLIPLIGIQKSIIIVVLIYFGVGGLILVLSPIKLIVKSSALVGLAILIILGFYLPGWNKEILTSGIYAYGDTYLKEKTPSELIFYKEGLSGTVAVRKVPPEELVLQINGKGDASNEVDLDTQLLSGHLPVLFHQNAKDVLVIGLGGGFSLGAVEQYPVEKIDALEIEPAVIEAAGYFAKYNNDALNDPRLNMIVVDARNYVLATDKKYDVITSEPSNPWITGVSNLFTKEYYELSKKRLNKGGIMAGWIHLYYMSESDLKRAIKTFQTVFPHTTVWISLSSSDLLLIGSEERLEINLDELSEKIGQEKVKQDLARIDIDGPETLFGYFLIDEEATKKFTGEETLHTDNYPYLEFSAPKSLYSQTVPANLRSLKEFQSLPFDILTEIKAPQIKNKIQTYFEWRKDIMEGEIAFGQRDFIKAISYFERAFSQDPNNQRLKNRLGEVYKEAGETYLRLGRRGQWTQLETIQESRIMLEKSLSFNDLDSVAHRSLGIAYGMLEMEPESERELKKAIELDPKDYIARNNLAYLYQLQENLDKAKEEWKKSLQINPNQPEIRKLLQSN